MQRPICSLLRVATLATAFTSCAQWPQIDGDYKNQLTYNDVLQIRALVRHRPELRPIYRISMYWPDRALVAAGVVVEPGDMTTDFIVRKKNGQWTIDESSIEKNRTIITSDARSVTPRPNQSLQPTAGRRDAQI